MRRISSDHGVQRIGSPSLASAIGAPPTFVAFAKGIHAPVEIRRASALLVDLFARARAYTQVPVSCAVRVHACGFQSM